MLTSPRLASDPNKLLLASSAPPSEDLDLGAVLRSSAARGRDTSLFIGSLLELPRLGASDRRIAFRQAIAELARAAGDEGPSPLEGIRAEALRKGIGAALENGLADDLDWLDPGAAGSALYQLAAALPVGAEQREIGRRVLARLLAGNADTFAVMATQMARAGGKGLHSTAVVARVALVVEIPITRDIPDAPLAFAIASRRNLAREYVSGPSTRSLPERRLAARLLERAARDAVRRALAGDRSAVRIIGPESALEPVWSRLLADREPLVWRHVAIARGLLAPFSQGAVEAIENELSPRWSPTEWRRAAAGLGGIAASKPDLALKIASRTFREGLLDRDRGAIAPFVWGLSRAAECEPEAARELLAFANAGGAEEVAEAIAVLVREVGEGAFSDHARERALSRLNASEARPGSDDGALAQRAGLVRDATGEGDEDQLGDKLSLAVSAFANEGARAAHEHGLAVLEAARGAVDTLLAIGDEDGDAGQSGLARRTSYSVVRDLDVALLERDVLVSLLRLDNREGRAKNASEAVEHLRDRIFVWLVERELTQPAVAPGKSSPAPAQLAHPTLHFARLRALLHLVDGEGLGRGEEAEGAALGRFRDAARALVDCFQRTPPAALRRALMATFARCLDALARAGACDVSDVVLVSSNIFGHVKDLETLAEASMDPDTRGLLSHLARVVAREAPPTAQPAGSVAPNSESPRETQVDDSLFPPAPRAKKSPREAALDALDRFGEELARVGTARSDGLRTVVTKLGTALRAALAANSQRDVGMSASEGSLALSIENAAFGLSQLFAGAKSRILEEATDEAPRAPSRSLTARLGRTIAGNPTLSDDEIEETSAAIVADVPPCFGALIADVIHFVLSLPLEATSLPPERRDQLHSAELPAWVPARRVLGAFYLERPLGAGGVGSVFVVTRVEDRHDPAAERFALKVPEYNANAARHLSETQFLALFRSEASALMGLPPHDSLAHFVTFDLSSRPKPILVMELVEGPNLERLIDTRMFDMQRAVAVLHQVSAGLAAMHEVGVAHLDLKPANVVLRGGKTAVLVDFGLAGRTIRPGCGSAAYSPPEVWGYTPQGLHTSATAADVYAFACLTFETLTGQLLFDADNEVNMISQHMSHDGLPPRLRGVPDPSRALGDGPLRLSGIRAGCIRAARTAKGRRPLHPRTLPLRPRLRHVVPAGPRVGAHHWVHCAHARAHFSRILSSVRLGGHHASRDRFTRHIFSGSRQCSSSAPPACASWSRLSRRERHERNLPSHLRGRTRPGGRRDPQRRH